MKVYTERDKNCCLKSCIIDVDHINEWSYLSMGIEKLLEKQKEFVQLHQELLSNTTAENYDFHKISKNLRKAEKKEDELKGMLNALNLMNTYALSEIDMDEIREKELWCK